MLKTPPNHLYISSKGEMFPGGRTLDGLPVKTLPTQDARLPYASARLRHPLRCPLTLGVACILSAARAGTGRIPATSSERGWWPPRIPEAEAVLEGS